MLWYNRTMPYKDPEKQKAAQKKHYQDNIDKYKEKSKTYRERVRKAVNDIKEADPCMDCNIFYPYYVMQFDHVSGEKIASVSYLTNRGTMDQALNEIKKCELVCSNCHAARTWRRATAMR
jgi:hypothetical protein